MEKDQTNLTALSNEFGGRIGALMDEFMGKGLSAILMAQIVAASGVTLTAAASGALVSETIAQYLAAAGVKPPETGPITS